MSKDKEKYHKIYEHLKKKPNLRKRLVAIVLHKRLW